MNSPLIQLGELLEIQNGFAFKSEYFNNDAARGMPLLRIRDIGSDETECFYDGEFREEFIVNSGDYVIGMDGDFVCRRWHGGPALLNQRVCRLQNFSPSVIPEFVYYALHRELEKIHKATAFVTVKHISSKQISNIPVRLPPVQEQRRIVELLDRAAEIRRRADAARAKARALIPALFLDTFGDPTTNPNGWQVKPLVEISSIHGGKRLAKGAQYAEEPTAHRYIRAGDITPGAIQEEQIRYISEEVWRPIRRYIVAAGDCVITIAGKIGVAAPVSDSLEGANLTENAARIRSISNSWVPDFLAGLLNSGFCQDQIAALTGRVTIGKLALERLGRVNVLLPPVALQTSFAERVHWVEALTRALDAVAAKTEKMAAALAAEMFDARRASGGDAVTSPSLAAD